MALHDLWSFDNAPVGTSLIQTTQSDQTKVTGTSTNAYNYYTQLPGCIMNYVASSPVAVSSDGFLTFTRSSSGTSNPLWFQLNQVFNFSITSRWAFGFRTKSSVAVLSTATQRIFSTVTSWNASLAAAILTEGDVAAPANTEVYVEVVVDLGAGFFYVYVNGALTRTTAITTGGWATALYVMMDMGGSAGIAASTRGYRDFYFLDLDTVDTGRLGPIRSSPLTLSNVAPADWVANGASSVASALTTPLENPPGTTVSASLPTDNQSLTATLNTALASTTPLVAVQPQASLLGDTLNNVLDTMLLQASNTIDAGSVKFPVSGNAFNQRWTPQRVAPDGGIWTPAKVNATTLKLNPISAGKTTLLLHFDGANGSKNFPDAAGNVPVANGDVVISTAQSKVGGASLYVDGINSSYLTVPGAVLSPGSGDWTVETWFYPTALNRISTFFRGDNGAAAGVGLDFGLGVNGLYAGINGNATTIVSWPNANLSVNNWYHIALVCASGKWTLYVNGVSVSTGTNSSLNTPTNNRIGGSSYSSSYSTLGYLDEMRVSNFARYTANFSPTMTAFVLD